MRTGSFLYSAPEQRVRGADIGWFADIYALGLILNEMFTGQVLQGTSYRTILTVTSEYPYLDDLVSVMTRQSPNERPASINAIKLDLKARGDAYVTQQQLSRERARVIQATEMDDPLVLEPPKVISFDWSPGTLELILSCPVNQDWVHVLQGGGIARYHQSGYGPDRFAFRDNIASVQIGSEMTTQSVQRVIDDFKEWITATNREYAVQVRRRMDKEQSRRVAEKAREIASLERKQKMLRELKV